MFVWFLKQPSLFDHLSFKTNISPHFQFNKSPHKYLGKFKSTKSIVHQERSSDTFYVKSEHLKVSKFT